MIRALFVILVTLVYTLVVGPPLLIHAILTGNSDPLYRIGRWGTKMAVWLAGARLEVRGLEKVPANRAVVFMANHQSNCDPPALLSVLPRVRGMAKKEFFRIPVLGHGMLGVGFIPVDRRNRERALAAVEEAVKALRAGYSFLVFPEGTRSRDGRLQPFKKGVFVMALKAGVPIVPVSVSGSAKIMRKGEFAIHPGVVRITFHDAVSTEGYTLEDRRKLMDIVRRAVRSGLALEEWPSDVPAGIKGDERPHGFASGGRHEVERLHGFRREDVDGDIVLYGHPEKGSLYTFGDGTWRHVALDAREVYGAGAEDLDKHLTLLESKPRVQPKFPI